MSAELDRALLALGLELDPPTRERLDRYTDTLLRWNLRMNLTALSGEALARRLVAEPLWAVRQLRASGSYLDIGSGNGSPAIPWIVSGAFSRTVLVESRKRRAIFLRRLSRILELPGVRVDAVRFEDVQPGFSVDWVTLQAIRLDSAMLAAIRQSCPGARIGWLSRSGARVPEPAGTLEIPDSDRVVRIIQV